MYDSLEIAIKVALNNHFVEYIVEYDAKFTLRLELLYENYIMEI